MLSLYKPEPADLWFKQQMLSDEATMAYNRAWGGTLPFPEDRWAAWHSKWVGAPASERRWPYQAYSMIRFETMRSPTVNQLTLAIVKLRISA